jgi:cytochrome d ubiquinol oxidase subunit I
MIGFGLLAALVSVLGLWFTRRRATRPITGCYLGAALLALVTPFAANSVGWIFTEMGRQPWLVFGILPTSAGVSPSVGTASVVISLVVFTLLYGVLAVVEGVLMVRYVKAGAPPPAADAPTDGDQPRPLAVAY